jgi:undecaprenyl-diphosphatase
MTTIDAILLGALQGATEFLPVSSSAHLVAAERLLHVSFSGLALEIALHFGTLLAIVIVFWRDLVTLARDGLVGLALAARGVRGEALRARAPAFGTALGICLGTVPVALVGILFEHALDRAFKNLTASGLLLIGTGAILILSRFAPAPRADRVGAGRAVLIGLAQAVAPLPGISRSGITIVAGYFLGLERRVAARFSFLLAVPAMVGAAVEPFVRRSAEAGAAQPGAGALAVGVVVSAAVGTACLVFLLRVVQRGRLHWFAAYCIPAGAAMAAAGLLT